MSLDVRNLEALSTRAGFNAAVRHIEKTIDVAGALDTNKNLGDILFECEDEAFTGERLALLLRMLLVDKLGYKTVSANLSPAAADTVSLAGEFAKWKAVDLVAAYHHPERGLLVANPKQAAELARFGTLRKRELLVLYAGKGGTSADELCRQAAVLGIALFQGAAVRVPPALYTGSFTVRKLKRAESPQAAANTAPRIASRATDHAVPRIATSRAALSGAGSDPVRMTPRYSVTVKNEFFHNGNVEAWKRIIASYNAKHPGLQVYIYYEGERILDINSLFQWGKVKHGSAIQFAVAGSDIRDVAKLQRYLTEGASCQFEAFIRSAANTVISLF
ncbi:hypothetical protein FACS1894142_5620 [Spirochaetia bacterium]|nr:hypothetical protein FACS1894142_5620 [Spirochaetia bacterium]